MSELVAFLLARITEDETGANDADEFHRAHGAWCDLIVAADHVDPRCTCDLQTRIHAECEAKRRIVREHEPATDPCEGTFGPPGSPCFTLRYMAAVYTEHPDFRGEWVTG